MPRPQRPKTSSVSPRSTTPSGNYVRARLGRRAGSCAGADLSGANLFGANLFGANLFGADLSHANLGRADLSAAKSLAQEQIDSAIGDGATELPPDLARPGWLEDGPAALVGVDS